VTDAQLPPGPLSGLRVLELADEKGQFCGKLLGDLGADVVKIEPPGGEPNRHIGPFLDDVPHPERSLSFWYYNTSKRGIILNLEAADGRQLFLRLATTADVVLESYPPGFIASLGLDYASLDQQNPRLILCSLTPFGQTGPWRDYLTSDLLHMAAGGEMASCGYDGADVPNGPPVAPGGGNAWHMGCHYACIAIMAALVERTLSGQGQYIDTSIHEACALTGLSRRSPITYTEARCCVVRRVVIMPPIIHLVPSSVPKTASTFALWWVGGSILSLSAIWLICSTAMAWLAISRIQNTRTRRSLRRTHPTSSMISLPAS
jgi:crotonobetainyl-CoA:carnitine CoA-transferase CaiB-like acyl-CoA transferase